MQKSSNIQGQGLIYLSAKYKINPQLPIELIYKFNNSQNEKVTFNLLYQLPEKYYLKTFNENNFVSSKVIISFIICQIIL